MNLLTQAQAARSLGITRQAVDLAIRRGRLVPSQAVGNGPPMLDQDEVERYRVARTINRGGRPRHRATA